MLSRLSLLEEVGLAVAEVVPLLEVVGLVDVDCLGEGADGQGGGMP